MKKIMITFLVCIFLIETTSGLMAGNENDGSTSHLENNIIKIALLSQPRILDSNDAKNFEIELTDYQWISGNTTYIFNVTSIDDDDVLDGRLTVDNFDVLVVPGGSIGDGEAFVRCFPTFQNFLWKRNMANFIRNGGGYYSVCGGTALITDLDLDRPPRSFAEYAYEESGLGVTWVKSHYETIAFPFLCHFGGLPPEYVGVSAYVMFSGWNSSDHGIHRYGGVCFDCPIMKDNPIFDDYLENTRRIRWVGGPSLTIPANPDREVKILASYPALEMSENTSTQIHAWKYVGGIRGIGRAIVESVKNNRISRFQNAFGAIYAYLGDWEMTDAIIHTDFANQPSMTSEIYPNEHQARVIMTGLHPEYNTWWGGSITEANDTNFNNLWDALHRWVNVTQNNETFENEFNYWINRRCVSWAAKIPDNDLPPVYGPSQVSDIYPYEQPPHFTIVGTSEVANGDESLDLYYRHSSDNVSWSSWALYEKDPDGSDGWAWEFSAPEGGGYYQFYSIRQVNGEEETSPPGPDAIAFIRQE